MLPYTIEIAQSTHQFFTLVLQGFNVDTLKIALFRLCNIFSMFLEIIETELLRPYRPQHEIETDILITLVFVSEQRIDKATMITEFELRLETLFVVVNSRAIIRQQRTNQIDFISDFQSQP
jgi:hypothetical protein